MDVDVDTVGVDGNLGGVDPDIAVTSEVEQDTGLSDSEPSSSEFPTETYTVKVGGEEKEVSLDELVSGYQMQSDYTRKTQALAEERARLADAERIVNALREDPSGTLQTLSQVYGVNLGSQGTQDTFSGYGYQEDPKPVDETVERLSRIEQALQAQQQASQRAALDAEISQIRDTFGEFDVDEVLSHALQNNLPSVTAAYRDLNFDRILAQQRAEADRQAKLEAKRATAGLVHSGGSSAEEPKGSKSNERMSVRDAFLAAKALHGSN